LQQTLIDRKGQGMHSMGALIAQTAPGPVDCHSIRVLGGSGHNPRKMRRMMPPSPSLNP